MDLLPSFLAFLQPFSQHLSARTFANLRTLLAGWLFAARHNVTGALRAGHDAALSGAARSPLRRHHSVYHRVFSAARWSLDAVGLALLDLIVTLPGANQAAPQQQEATIEFHQARQRHPGIESAINALQAGNGLGRCRDRTEQGFSRYIQLGSWDAIFTSWARSS